MKHLEEWRLDSREVTDHYHKFRGARVKQRIVDQSELGWQNIVRDVVRESILDERQR